MDVKAYLASIYIPAKSELTTTLQSVTHDPSSSLTIILILLT